ncbi:hypothetical protein Patl1_19504 [Pistacia atlantica]|uniref:Uncharacterized protein n=1 Tax=Pistacia atlantica TaxID=434234 RepID=A0ACC1C216_9ROSI|nr:hypothetical protein Patl1_19504 [Pistacia atlantica]
MVRGEALRAYRDLIKLTRYSFTEDTVMLRQSVKEIRKRFNKNRHVNSDTEIKKSLNVHVYSLF